jgi:hypothetical protein
MRGLRYAQTLLTSERAGLTDGESGCVERLGESYILQHDDIYNYVFIDDLIPGPGLVLISK